MSVLNEEPVAVYNELCVGVAVVLGVGVGDYLGSRSCMTKSWRENLTPGFFLLQDNLFALLKKLDAELSRREVIEISSSYVKNIWKERNKFILTIP